ncbi:MAG: DUF2628 domain-containing protein, partial [Bacteroidota bacterium]
MEVLLDDSLEGNDTVEEWKAFIGKETDYYLEKWKRIKEGKTVNFNFFALLFGGLWLVYRKAYVAGFLYLGFIMIEGVVFETLAFEFDIIGNQYVLINAIIGIANALLMGIFGDWLYYTESAKRMSIIENKSSDRTDYLYKLHEKGGVSWLA